MFSRWFRKHRIVVPAIERTAERQAAVDAETADLALYYLNGCRFCTSVRTVTRALELCIELRDVGTRGEHYRDLLTFGGRTTVPCLRIGKAIDPAAAQWMFESRDIIAYLIERFGTAR